MTAPFTTTAEAARRREAEAEREVERLKRALESLIASDGFRPRSPVGNFCAAIGMEVRISRGAGVEFAFADALALAHAMEITPMPDALRRYYE